MTRIYIEAAVGALLAIVLITLGWHFGSLSWKGKYTALVSSQNAASAEAANNAAKRIQDERAAYDTQLHAITDTYHREVNSSDLAADDLSRQLREYESRLSRCSVPKGASAASGAHDTAPQPASDSRVTEAIARVIQSAGLDAKQLTALEAERASLK